jgi:IclR family acetate operon transcriptional repressor
VPPCHPSSSTCRSLTASRRRSYDRLVEQEFQGTAPGAQAIERAARLLVLVLVAERPSGLGELATAAELPKSTASRLLGALERQGLVAQRGARGRFSAGPVLLRFAQRGLADRHLGELAEPHLRVLAEGSGETVNLAVPGSIGVDHLAEVSSRHFLGTGRWVGRRVPYHCTAVGKVLLAFGAAALPDAPLEALTEQTIVDTERLAAELAAVRRVGTAAAVDELEVGLTAVAAPVRGEGGEVVAALTISGPTLRLGPERLAVLGPELTREADALSERLTNDAQPAA